MPRVVINNGDTGLTVRNAINSMTAEIYAGQIFPTVATFADLPAASGVPNAVYRVTTSTGVWLVNRKTKGLYASNGTTWDYIGDYPVTAADIGFVPAGGVGATNVQSALSELDSEKQKLIATGPTAPGSPVVGDIWIETA
jgi:hypothetical protein